MVTGLILICLAAITLMVLWKPPIAVGFALSQFAVEQFAQFASPLFSRHFALINYFSGAMVALALLVTVVRYQSVWRPYPKAALWILGLIFWAILSYVWCQYEPAYRVLTVGAMPYWLTFIVMMPLIIRRPEDLRLALISAMAIAIVPLLITFFSATWVGRGYVVQEDTTGQWVAKQGKSLPLVLSLSAAYVALIFTLLRFKGLGQVLVVLRWLAVVFSVVFILRTGSRGQLLAMTAVLMIFIPLSRQWKRAQDVISTTIMVALFALIVGGVLIYVVEEGSKRWEIQHIVESLKEGRVDRSVDVLSSYVEAGPMWWLIGLGNSASYHPEIHGFMPEVLPVEVLAEEGLIGFFLFIGGIIAVYTSFRRSLHLVRDHPDLRATIVAVTALFTLELILSLKQGSLVRGYMMFGIAIIILRWEMLVHGLISRQYGMLDQTRTTL